MIEVLRATIVAALGRLSYQLQTDAPPALAALIILFGALLIARLVRWLITKAFKGIEIDEWLRRSGLPLTTGRAGRVHVARVIAQSAYWIVVIAGVTTALSVFGLQVTTRLATSVTLLLPKVLLAAAIVIAGLWLGRYFGRSTLVWAVNEDVPSPRKVSLAVRLLTSLTAVAVAAHVVEVAAPVFLAAFILVTGGVVLAASLAVGLGAREAVRRHLEPQDRLPEADRIEERSLWNHL